MKELFSIFLTQITVTFGVVLVFGLLISMFRKIFCRVAGKSGYWILLFSGLVGTPVHELSHALMCVIFRHRIEEIKLYSPGNPDRTLGYVAHSYNKKSLYQNVGHFFIGTAPITCGGLVILLLMYLLSPEVYYSVSEVLGEGFTSALGAKDMASEFLQSLVGAARVIFRSENFSSATFWVFMILAIMISSHMELSFSDIRSGFVGFTIISALLFLADLVLWWVLPDTLTAFTEAIGGFSLYLAGFLGISVVFLALMVIVALVVRLILSLFARR